MSTAVRAGVEEPRGEPGPGPWPQPASTSVPEHLDVLIVGAGIAGVGAAATLTRELPELSFAVFERRQAIGGTWDLFRYPGVRSDSDMLTMGYRFRPWSGTDVLGSGATIRQYVVDTAVETGVIDQIRLRHAVSRVSWDSTTTRWTVTYRVEGEDADRTVTCSLLWGCTGYYDYEDPYRPEFTGDGDFGGRIVHPQLWPEDLDVEGKRIVVIGSGATAVTLVPALAQRGARVTMLQRSPSYVVSLPDADPLGARVRARFSPRRAHRLLRVRNLLAQTVLYQASRRMPSTMRRLITSGVAKQLPADYAVDPHFTPAYAPWDQRLCFVPDGDLFAAIRSQGAQVVTAAIDRFVPDGIRLADGRVLEADVVVTATGLNLLAIGGLDVVVDGETVDVPGRMAYKSVMLDGVPNFVFVVGYPNASWMLKADLVSTWVVRLVRQMRRRGATTVVPLRDPDVNPAPLLGLTSGYIQRALDRIPSAGDRGPWRARQNYLRDLVLFRYAPLADSSLQFGSGRTGQDRPDRGRAGSAAGSLD